jgi:hypothetical protein
MIVSLFVNVAGASNYREQEFTTRIFNKSFRAIAARELLIKTYFINWQYQTPAQHGRA